MSDENKLKQAQACYKTVCEMLDERDWHYEKDEEKLTINCGAQGEDLPIEIYIEVDSERQIVSLLSPMPFIVPEDRRAELAVAVSKANYGIVDGSFDYSYLNGKIVFRLTSSYRESLIGKTLFEYMLMCACYLVDEYNDKFLIVAKSEMSVDEILDYIK